MLIAGLIIPVYLSVFDQKIIDFVDDADTWLLICIFMEDVCGQDSGCFSDILVSNNWYVLTKVNPVILQELNVYKSS